MRNRTWLWLAIFILLSVAAFPAFTDVGPAAPELKAEAPAPPPPPAVSQVTTYQSSVTTTSETPSQQYMVGDKLARGLANVLASPLEIPRNVQNMTDSQGVLVGWTGGLAQGIGMMALRIIVGAYEIITFPIPIPEDYKPVLEPEFVWQAPGPKITPQGKTGKD